MACDERSRVLPIQHAEPQPIGERNMTRTRMNAAVLAAAALVSTTACNRTDTAAQAAPATATAAPAAPPAAGAVKIVADEHGYTPSSVSVAKGSPVTLEFVRTTDKTCATEVVFPDLNVNKPLPLNTPVDIPVPAGDVKTYAFACGMGMYRGKVVVQ